jgi:eukaryotic-like serine/threonine-protein kinase
MRPESASHPVRIGRYEIVGEVGRGTMGIVYEARDPVLGRTVALKTIDTVMAAALGAPAEFERRFFREAEIAARLSHPGIVACHDVGKDADTGTLFMVLEYLPGRTLSANLKSHGAMPWYQAVPIVAVVARAVHHAHAQGVVHRDLKPGNIMLLDSGDPKIMDFGIAKASSSRNMTVPGQFLGSPLYSSPEQALGHPADARSDIFALGSILCSLLEGRHHFAAPAIPEIAARIIREDPPRLSPLLPGVPPALDEVIARAMAKAPADRYPTAEAMADDLEDVLASRPPRHGGGEAPVVGEGTEPPTGASAQPTAAATRPLGARWLVAMAAVALGGVLVTGLGVLAVVLHRIRSTPDDVSRFAETLPPSTAAPERLAPLSAEPRATPAEAVSDVGATEAASAPDPAGAPTAVGTPEVVRTPAAAEPVRRAPAAARTPLHLVIEHTLKNGRLRLWIDQSLAYETKLEAAVSKKIVAIKIRDARLEHTLEVEPGRHEIRVAVEWDDNQRMESTLADIRSEPRELAVKLGRLRKKLSLEWREAGDRTSAAAGRPD